MWRKILIGIGALWAIGFVGMIAQRIAPTVALSFMPPDSGAPVADRMRLALARGAVVALRSSLRDPDSLVLERVFVAHGGLAVCLSYRAKNGFGGMDRASAVYDMPNLSQSATDWNHLCLGEVAYDVPLRALR